MLSPFHLAFLVRDMFETRQFYGNVLGCEEGRSNETWIDFSLFGPQVVAHLDPQSDSGEASSSQARAGAYNPVDRHDAPVPHSVVALAWDQWQSLSRRLQDMVIEPGVRFLGQLDDQATRFLLDSSGNALELIAFKDPQHLFAT